MPNITEELRQKLKKADQLIARLSTVIFDKRLEDNVPPSLVTETRDWLRDGCLIAYEPVQVNKETIDMKTVLDLLDGEGTHAVSGPPERVVHALVKMLTASNGTVKEVIDEKAIVPYKFVTNVYSAPNAPRIEIFDANNTSSKKICEMTLYGGIFEFNGRIFGVQPPHHGYKDYYIHECVRVMCDTRNVR